VKKLARRQNASFFSPAACSLACYVRLASSGASLPCLLPGLEPLGDFLRLLNIFIGRAPEDDASGQAPACDRHIHLTGHAEDVVLHPPGLISGPSRMRMASVDSD
jgi:hypothetical protein